MPPTVRAPFVVDPVLTGVAVGYKNPRRWLIADQVFSDVPVEAEAFEYDSYDLLDSYRIPDTLVDRTSPPNSVEFKAKRDTAKTEDHFLRTPIPMKDEMNERRSRQVLDQRQRKVLVLRDLIDLAREKRTAAVVQDANNYDAALVSSPANLWTDTTNGTPVDDVWAKIDEMIMEATHLVFNLGGWRAFIRHPQTIAAIKGDAGGNILREAVAEYFEVEQVLVGMSREAAVNKKVAEGDIGDLSQIWGNDLSVLHQTPTPENIDGPPTFGFRAVFGSIVAGVTLDPDMGAYGGEWVREGQSVLELATANKAGALLQTVI